MSPTPNDAPRRGSGTSPRSPRPRPLAAARAGTARGRGNLFERGPRRTPVTAPGPGSRVFRDALLVTQDPTRRVLVGDLAVDHGRIVHVGPGAPAVGEEIDASGLAIVPGFVNTHAHVAMSLLRGIADDRDLGGFLEVLFAVDARRTELDLEAGAAAGIAEMLLAGTTSFLDLYYGEDAIARAVERLGIRGFLGWAVLDPAMTT